MIGMASFRICCKYRRFVIVPSIKIGPTSLYLLIAHHTMHFAEWSDDSKTLWIFRGPGSCVLFVTEPIEKEMGLLHAVRHLAQCAQFSRLQIPDGPACSGTTFSFPTSHPIEAQVSDSSSGQT